MAQMAEMAEMAEMAFSVQDLTKHVRGFSLQIDRFHLERGYVLGLIGPNGAGKSTLIKTLLNLIHPDQGRITVLGLAQPEHETEIKQRVGYVSELPGFYPDMTVGWTIKFASRYYRGWNDALEQRLVRKFGLDRGKRVKELSRGMRVKLALTIALAHEPELLILDEPTSGLDPLVRAELLAEIAAVIRDERRSVLFSSHITPDVEQVADFIAVAHNGRIIEHAEKDAFLARWKRVTGRAGKGDAGLAPMFQMFDAAGGYFSGVTDRYSRDWEADLIARGAERIQVTNMTLDQVLGVLIGHRQQEAS